MRFFVDECLSPTFARLLVDAGHDAIHPRDLGRLQDPDHVVLRRAIEEDRTIITENGRDFLKLLRSVDLHPGLVIFPNVSKDQGRRLVAGLLAFLLLRDGDRPEDAMVNRVVVVAADGAVEIRTFPPP